MNKSILKTLSFSVLCSAMAISVSASDEMESTSRTVASDIEWHEVAPGRSIAAVKGDFKTGAHVKFIKFSAGVKTAPHKHSYSYIGVILSGNMRHFEPGKPETVTVLSAGSYYEIGAEVAHISECLPGNECVFVTQSDGAFDLKAAE